MATMKKAGWVARWFKSLREKNRQPTADASAARRSPEYTHSNFT
jgi:hypothetical protein